MDEDLLKYLDSLRIGRDITEVMLRGMSALDSRTGIPVRSPDSAQQFLLAYGFDIDQPVEAAEMFGNYHESIRFIRKYFLKPENPEGASLEVPKIFHELSDLRQLLLYSSDKSVEHTARTRWACAILRVMHTIAHLDKDLRHDFFASIQQQVFDRFYKELHNVEGKLYLGDPKKDNSVDLAVFQTKPRKARESAILKLLHKPENVAEDLFDQVGVRFVTKNTADIIRVVKYLRDRFIIMPMNIRPSRSRNNLIDPYLYRRSWRLLRSNLERGSIKTRKEMDAFLENQLTEGAPDTPHGNSPANPFSSQSYRSIQFTCRQLIKYRNPVYEDLKQLKLLAKTSDDAELKKITERIDLSHLTREQRFFYPFEVQIFDLKNHEEAESGKASHTAYKAAQVQAAMRRVLGPLLIGS